MRIAILGGSFDPPHKGHELVANQILRHFGIEEVWLMPCFVHPFNKSVSSPTHRFAMAKLLENDKIKASDFEIKKRGMSFTIETLYGLSRQYPQHTFFWILGSDQLPSFQKWKDWQGIIRKYNVIIYPRGDDIVTEKKVMSYLNLKILPKNVIITAQKDIKKSSISSTLVRQMAKEEKPINSLVPKPVATYIQVHQLYQ